MYALIKNSIVENCIVADATFIESIKDNWDIIVPMDTIDACAIGWTYADNKFVPPPLPPEPPKPADPCEWLIDLGPFYSRLGTAKIAVLMSADAGVKARLADININKWVDLSKQDIKDYLQYIGTVVSELTPELQNTILTTPVTIEENRALRKSYF